MKIRFDYEILVSVVIVFVVTSANAKNIPQNPVANNQSSPDKPSMGMSSDKINFFVSRIEAPEKSTTVNTAKPALVTSTSLNTASTTTINVPGPANNTTAMSFIKQMANNITSAINGTTYNSTATTSIVETVGPQTVKIANVGTANENRTDGGAYLDIKNIILFPTISQDTNDNKQPQCPKGYTITYKGECLPSSSNYD